MYLMQMVTDAGTALRVRVDWVSPRPHQMAYYALQGTKGAVREVRQRGSHVGTADRRAHEILAQVGPNAAVVLICCDDQATREAVVAAAADRATESWDGSRARFLAGLEPGSQHDWVRAALDEPSKREAVDGS